MKELQRDVNQTYKISPSLTFYLICSIQIGVGVLSFQKGLIERVAHDAWISVLIAGILVHVFIWMIFKILKFGNGDIITIHHDLFGKWLGGLLSSILILFYFGIGVIVTRSFVQVVQVWMFPDLNVIFFLVIFLTLVYYLVSGGFRVVTGVCFLGTVIPSYLIFTLIYTMDYTDFSRLLPVWNHSTSDILLSAKDMTLSFIGFTTVFMFYPYLKNKEKSSKWGYAGNFLTLSLYLLLIIFAIAYFTRGHVTRHNWPTLTMWKTVEMPFVERFEYIGISSWTLIILPNICLAFWAATRGIRQLFRFSQRIALIIILVVTLISNYLIKTHEHLILVNKYFSEFAFYLYIIYLPLLLIFTYFRLGRRKKFD